MATDLPLDDVIPLKFSPGMILSIKSSNLDLSAKAQWLTELELYNQNYDTLLRIRFRWGYNKVFLNDRADKSIAGGWGEERSVDLDTKDVDRWRSGFTISVYDCSTHSSEQYQILFDLTTVYNFDKRFRGQAIGLAYRATWAGAAGDRGFKPCLSNLKVILYKLDDLPASERQAIQAGKAPLAIPAPNSTAISLPSSDFVPNQPRACISWDDGKEMRIYHLGLGNVLQEYAYSASKERYSWHHGSLGIILDPNSSLAAIRCKDDVIGVYYQDPKSDVIHILLQCGPTWGKVQTTNTRAIKGSGIAVAEYSDANGAFHSRIYYQDPQLRLRELVYNASTRKWLPGDFNPGVQPRGTPIMAEGVHGGDVDINVMWRDTRGRAVSRSWSNLSGWDASNDGRELVDGRD